MTKPIKSPCINVCYMNEDSYCQGCFRTEKEITLWTSYSEDERREVNAEAMKRRQDAGFVF